MKKITNLLVVTVNFLFLLAISQASFAQLTPEQWFEIFNNGLGGEDARQPGANNGDVQVCKDFMEENPGIFDNLGKCANMTPADLQFLCNNVFIRDLLLVETKGECVRFMMHQMGEKKRNG